MVELCELKILPDADAWPADIDTQIANLDFGGDSVLFESFDPSVSTDSLDSEQLREQCRPRNDDYQMTFADSGHWQSGIRSPPTQGLTTWGRIRSTEPLDDRTASAPDIASNRGPLTSQPRPASLLANFVDGRRSIETRYVDLNDNEIPTGGGPARQTTSQQPATTTPGTDRWRFRAATAPAKPRRTFADLQKKMAPELQFLALPHQVPVLCDESSSLSLSDVIVNVKKEGLPRITSDLDAVTSNLLQDDTPDSGLGCSGPSHIEDWASLSVLLPNTGADHQLPAWLGLSNNAETVLLTIRGETMLRNMLKVSDDELAFSGDGEKEEKPQWMAQLNELAQQLLKLLPKDITRLRRTVDNIKDPLFRFFEREVNLGADLLKDIRHDLEEVIAVCRAEKKQNNETRALASALQKGQVPSEWLRYTVPRDVTVMDWVLDYSKRVKQLIRIGSSENIKREEVWLGGCFSAEAYITATRQLVAQTNVWSLEQLHLHVHIGHTDRSDVFRINGIDIRGAQSLGGHTLELSDDVQSPCDCVEFSWMQSPAAGVRLPLYLYGDRKQLVSSLAFLAEPATSFYERGVALVANTGFN